MAAAHARSRSCAWLQPGPRTARRARSKASPLWPSLLACTTATGSGLPVVDACPPHAALTNACAAPLSWTAGGLSGGVVMCFLVPACI